MIAKIAATLAVLVLATSTAEASSLWTLKETIRSYRKLGGPKEKHFDKMKKALIRAKRSGHSNEAILAYLSNRIKNPEDKSFYQETMTTLKDDLYDAEASIFFIMDKIRTLPAKKYFLIEALYGSALVMVYGFPRN